MSQLRTYDREELSVIGIEYGDDVPTEPGQVVSHIDFRKTTFGTIVAIDEHHATVLWSKEPYVVDVGTFTTGGYAFAPYVPLQVTPTIFSSGSFFSTGSVARYSQRPVNPGYFVTGSFR